MLGFLDDLGLPMTTTADVFASCYEPSHFLAPHHDTGNGQVGFTLKLTREWQPQYGGLLMFLDDDWRRVRRVCTPQFNSLCRSCSRPIGKSRISCRMSLSAGGWRSAVGFTTATPVRRRGLLIAAPRPHNRTRRRMTRPQVCRSSGDLYVAPSEIHGLVCSPGASSRGDTIEICPTIVVPLRDRRAVESTILSQYSFAWGKRVALAQGYGGLYNHSYDPTARFEVDIAGGVIRFMARRLVGADEEITINYNGRPKDTSPVWFDQ